MKTPLQVFDGFFRHKGIRIREAQELLGKDNVVTRREATKRLDLRFVIPRFVPYTRKTLAMCAEENKQASQWWLLFTTGMSLLQLKSYRSGKFCRSSIWDKHPNYVDEKTSAGYLLVNSILQLVGENRKARNVFFEQHQHLQPLKLPVAAESLILWNEQRGQKILDTSFHYTDAEGDMLPLLGSYDEHGMLLSEVPADIVERLGLDKAGVLVSWKPE